MPNMKRQLVEKEIGEINVSFLLEMQPFEHLNV